MKNTHLIWIPSLQTNIRFKELDNSQYRTILKNVNDDSNIDFIYNLNEILRSNLIDPIDFDSLTILDRFIITIYLKILCYGPLLDLSKQCEKCDNKINIRFDLNNLLDKLGTQIDRTFKTIIQIPAHPLQLICDLPTIRQEFDTMLFEYNSNKSKDIIETNIDKYLTGYIRSIASGDVQKNLDSLTPIERNVVVNKIPGQLILAVKSQFTTPLYELFNDVNFLEMECKECKDKTEIKLETGGLISLLKTFFHDSTIENVFGEYFNIASIGHINPSFVDTLTPKEMNLLTEFVKISQKKNENNGTANNSVDLFAEDNPEIAGMTKSPSEFSGF
jgi:hypothetical protein